MENCAARAGKPKIISDNIATSIALPKSLLTIRLSRWHFAGAISRSW